MAPKKIKKNINSTLKVDLLNRIEEIFETRLQDIISLDELKEIIDDFSSAKLVPKKNLQRLIGFSLEMGSKIESKNNKNSLKKALSPASLKALEDILDEPILLTDSSKEFIDKIVHSAFIKNLFSETIHVSIVSFYKKVNPLFGGLATSVLEKQIRGAIDFIIDKVLDVATLFIVSEKNMDRFSDFLKAVVLLSLEEPLNHYYKQLTPGHTKKIVHFLLELQMSSQFETWIKERVITAVELVYDEFGDEKIGTIIPYSEPVRKIVDKIADVLAA